MEGAVQGNRHQGGGPHAVGWVDEETARETGEAVADEVGGQADEDLVAEAAGVLLVEHVGQDLRPDDVLRVGERLGRVGHDGDEHVLLLVEAAGVQVVLGAEEGELVGGHELLPSLAYWVCQLHEFFGKQVAHK